jgi:Domain of unknown function (DUF4190)
MLQTNFADTNPCEVRQHEGSPVSRNIMTNHGQSFRLRRKGDDVPGEGASGRKKADWALGASLLGLIIVPLVASAAGVVLGILAIRETAADTSLTGRNRAVWGVILGTVGLLWWGRMLFRTFG